MESLHQLAEAALGPCRRLCSRCTAPLAHAVRLPSLTLYSYPYSFVLHVSLAYNFEGKQN